MEIQVYNPTQAQPLPAITWNYLEVKQWVEDGLQAYKGRVYDDTQIAEAKKDRANLNKLATAIDAKRKEMKALYLAPYEQFEKEAKELVGMIKTVSEEIDAQVKAYDEFRKEEKLAFIKDNIYTPMIGNLAELVPYVKLHNPKWLNVTTSAAAVADEMAKAIENIENGLNAIDQLNLDADIAERVKSVFLKDFDLTAAIAEKNRIEAEREKLARYQAAQQARVAEATPPAITAPVEETQPTEPTQRPVAEEELLTVAFRIRVTRAQLDGLGAYMRANNIKPERV